MIILTIIYIDNNDNPDYVTMIDNNDDNLID